MTGAMSVEVPLWEVTETAEVTNPPHAPMSAAQHVCLQPRDVLPQTIPAICPECALEAEHPVKFDNGAEVELQCRNCRAAIHVEVTDR